MNLKIQSSVRSEATLQFPAPFDRTKNQVGEMQACPSFDIGAHFRKIVIVIFSALCRTWVPFILLGALNRVFPTFASIFFCYAGNERYAEHYSYPSCRNFLLWFPSAIGAFRQGKRWGLICAAPVTEAEFTDPKNAAYLLCLVRRLQQIKTILGVGKLSFAGILPTILNRKCPETMGANPDRTPEVVRRAVREVQTQHFNGRQHHVVLLGGAGRIGRAVQNLLKLDGTHPIMLDAAEPESASSKILRSPNVLLVDVSRHGAIQRYLDEIPTGTVVLNEVFPEPSRAVLTEFRNKNVVAYHIAGVPAEVYPSLPLGYRNALPCCAIHSRDVGSPILRRIS